jgi:ethanolamine utilization microcompartment shell protein EutL
MLQNRLDEPVWLFPFEGMAVGESFFIPTLQPAQMIYVVDTRAKAAKVRVKALTSQKDGCLGVRVWRIR